MTRTLSILIRILRALTSVGAPKLADKSVAVRRRRHGLRWRMRLGVAFSVVVGLTAATGGFAWFSSHGSGTSGVTVGSLTGAVISAPSTSGASITITWDQQAAMNPTSANSGIVYTVMRSFNGGGFAAVPSGPCAAPLAYNTGSCVDTVALSGSYQYRVDSTYSTWTAPSNVATVTATVDIVAPTTTISITPVSPNGSNGWYKTTPTFTLSSSDNVGGTGVASTFYKIGSGSTQTYAGGSVPIPDGAAQAITYWSTDNAGNVETQHVSSTLKIDTVKPTLNLTTLAPTASGSVYAGGLVGTNLYFNAVQGSTSCNNANDGGLRLQASATDATSGLPTQVTFPGVGSLTNWTAHTGSENITGSGSNPTIYTSTDYRWNAPTGCVPVSTPAATTITVTDLAGNSTSVTLTWVADTTTPTVSFTFPASAGNYNATTWNAGCVSAICGTATDTAIQKVELSIRQGTAGNYWNGTSFSSATQVWNLTTLSGSNWSFAWPNSSFPAEGTYQVQARVTNGAQAQATNTARNFVYDNTAPTGSITAPLNGATVNGASVAVSSNSTDTGGSNIANATFQYSPHGANTWTQIASPDTSSPYGVTWTFSGLVDSSQYDVRVITTDNAGNSFTSAPVTVLYKDTVPPAVSLTLNPATTVNTLTTNITATWNANKNGTYSVTVNSAADCTGGTLIASGAYTTSPSNVVTNISPTALNEGSNTIRVCVTDALGNLGTTSKTLTKDTAFPTVVSINRAASNPTNTSGSIAWTVTFSRTVTGVDAADFQAVANGIFGIGTLSVTGSGTTRTVTLSSTGIGEGTIGLNLVDNDTILDSVNNPLGGPGTTGQGDGSFTGQPYTIDKTPPAVATTQVNGANVAFPYTTNQSVTSIGGTCSVGDNAITWTVTGTASRNGTATCGGIGTWTATISPALTSGTYNLNASQTDAAGNTGIASQQTLTIDTTPPTVSSINRVGSSPTNGVSVSWTVTFSESVTGVDASDFTLVGAGASGASLTGVTGSGTTWTVTASTGADGALGLNLVDDDSIADAAGNPLAGTGTGNGNFTGQTFTIDKTAPAVVSINRHTASPTNASSVQFDITFSESVTGVDTTDFALATTGVTGASKGTFSGTGTSYTLLVNTGSGDGTIGLNLVDDDTIIDTAGNKLGGTGTGNGNLTGQVYAVDKTAPVVTLTQVNGSTVTFTYTTNQTVTSIGGACTTGDNNVAYTITGNGAQTGNTPCASGAWTATLTTAISSAGTSTLSATQTDAATNSGSTGSKTLTIDKTAPTVSSIARVTATPTNAASVQWTVTFSESVTGVDATDFQLAAGGAVTTPQITGVTGSGTTWTVTASTGTGDGTLGLNLVDDDTISDPAGNPLGGTGTGTVTTGAVYTIDKTAPTVVSINRHTASPTNASSVQFDITFSEPVTGVDTTDFALAASGVTGTKGASSGSGTTYTLTVTSVSGNGTLGLNLADDDTIVDTAGNKLGGAGTGNGNFAGQLYAIDQIAPVVSLTQVNGSTVTFPFTTGQSVTSIGGACTTGDNNVSWTITGNGAQSGSTTCSAGAWTATLTTAISTTGTSTLSVTQSDTAGNSGTSGNKTLNVDKTPPTVSSIVLGGASPTNATSVTWTVTFSEAVTGVDTTDFQLSPTLTNALITGVTGSGTTWTVTANTGVGDGSLQLNLFDNDSITDGVGNPLGGTGTGGVTNGAAYAIDKTAPTVTINQASGQADPTTGSPINFTVVFSESTTDFATGDVTLAGTAGATTAAVTGSGTTYNVAVSGMTASGTVIASLAAGVAHDAAGNAATSSTSTDNTVTYTAPPTVTFNTSGSHTLTVPAHTTTVTFTITGAGGGGGANSANTNGAGGNGGRVSGTINLPDSASATTFTVIVGGGGGSSNSGGGAGGSGGTGCAAGGAGGNGSSNDGGGGGGATCVYVVSTSPVLVAGGGGGGGTRNANAGGNGNGGQTANPGTSTGSNGTDGGSTNNGGNGGSTTTTGSRPFGITNAGGAGATGNNTGGNGGIAGGAGGAGAGTNNSGNSQFGGGGGGGGEASGGGGGDSANTNNGGGGGGGGSGYTGGTATISITGITVTTGTNGGASGVAGTAGSATFTGVGISGA